MTFIKQNMDVSVPQLSRSALRAVPVCMQQVLQGRAGCVHAAGAAGLCRLCACSRRCIALQRCTFGSILKEKEQTRFVCCTASPGQMQGRFAELTQCL